MNFRWDGLFSVAIALIVGSCGPQSSNNAAVAARTEKKPASGWEYRVSVDKMRDERTFVAELTSNNAPELEFPYTGGSPLVLQIAKVEGDSYPDNWPPQLVLSNGQFDCSGGGATSCYITVKADAGKPIDLYGVESECGTAKCLTLHHDPYGPLAEKSVIDLLRATHHLTIEVPLYRFGSYQYEFDTAGLRWSKDTTRQ